MAITPLPPAPSRADPANFAAKGDAFLSALLIFATEATALQVDVNAKQATVAANAIAAQLSRDAALAAQNDTNVINAKANGDKAAQAKLDAQGYAAQAQAVSPDSPIRINTARVAADFTLASGYNAASAGPIEIAENIIVTISDNATWSIL